MEVEVGVVAVHLLGQAGHQPSVREHDSLGETGGAGGVGKGHHGVRVDLYLRHRRLVGGENIGEGDAAVGEGAIDADDGNVEVDDLGDVAGLGEDDAGGGCGRLLGDLGRGVEGVGGGDDGAEAGGGEEGEGEGLAVGKEEHEDFPAAEAEAVEACGGAAGKEIDVGVCQSGACEGVDEAGAVAVGGEVLEAVGVEGEVVRDLDVGKLRPEDGLLRRRIGAHFNRSLQREGKYLVQISGVFFAEIRGVVIY